MSVADLTSLVNHQIRLATRPVGLPTRQGWSFTEEAVTEPQDGGVVWEGDLGGW